MDKSSVYEIRVAGHLPQTWSAWFAGLAIHNDPHGETVLCGPLVDQAALFGLLGKIQSLNLTLVAVNRVDSGKDPAAGPS
jgi:hypothetical protein